MADRERNTKRTVPLYLGLESKRWRLCPQTTVVLGSVTQQGPRAEPLHGGGHGGYNGNLSKLDASNRHIGRLLYG